MKRIVFALLVVALAAPASAEVMIICEMVPDEPNIIVSYVNGEDAPVHAFALEITVDVGTIEAVSCLSDDYYIYPGSIMIEDGEVEDFGSCVASIDSNVAIVEMGSLYAPEDACHPDGPPDEGELFIITVDLPFGFGDITITENTLRGGVVMEDLSTPDVNSPSCGVWCHGCLCPGDVVVGHFITQAMYDNWVTVGKPVSWCHSCHSRGDVDLNCLINAADVIGPAIPNLANSFPSAHPGPTYHPDCDFNNDKQVNAADVIGSFPGDPNCIASNFPSTCPPATNPETMDCP
jgi:hypothetical protein